MASFGWCCCSGDTPQSLVCWISGSLRGKIGAGGMEGDSGIVMEDVCRDDVQNLEGRLVLMLMRPGILCVGVVVVAVGVMVMVEVVPFSEGRCLPVVEVECVVVDCGLV